MFPPLSLRKAVQKQKSHLLVYSGGGVHLQLEFDENPKSRASLRQTAAFDNTDNMPVRCSSG
jgi:hypothetical protein